MPTDRSPSPWTHRLALLTASATLLLILFGGLVTGLGAGMAVPDWPTTFGHNMFLFPWAAMVGGIFYEHTHRLIGSVVGLLTIGLCVAIWAGGARPWLRGLGIVAVALVVIQGILGGLRVVLVADWLALVHGVVAPGFFALVACLALATSAAWTAPAGAVPDEWIRPVSRWGLAVTLGLYLQIALGAVLTHTGTRLDAHLTGALLVSAAVLILARRIQARRAEWPELGRAATALHALWGLQLLLGLGAYLTRFQAALVQWGPALGLAFPVAHRITGALMLAAALCVILLAARRRGWQAPAPRAAAAATRMAA